MRYTAGKLTDRRSKFAIEFSGGLTLMDGIERTAQWYGALKYF
jgi:hypothetical protein